MDMQSEMDFRVSFQKALLDNNAIIAKATEVMEAHNKSTSELSTQVAVLTEVIGKDDKAGMRKFICLHEVDIRGEGNKPGLWTVVGRITITVGGICTIGGIVIVSYVMEHPDVFSNLIQKLFPGG
jgi:hypothetical protein